MVDPFYGHNRDEATMVTNGGRVIDLLGDMQGIHIRDIAHHLSRINRYLGATEKAINVAQHSVLVSQLCGYKYGRFMTAGLLHDAHEAYTGDVGSPQKAAIRAFGKSWDQFEDRIKCRVRRHFGVSEDDSAEVRSMDRLAVQIEVAHAGGIKMANAFSRIGIPPKTVDNFKLLGPEESMMAFLAEAKLCGIY